MTSQKLLHTSKCLLYGGIAGLSLLWGSCTCHRQQLLQDGIWRAELSVSHGRQAPFLFEVANAKTDSAVLTLINGEEKTLLTGIYYVADSVIIPIEAYDALIKAHISDGVLEGRFTKNYIENDTGILFKARWGEAPRFAATEQPATADIDGKWDILFVSDGDTAHNVGIFKTENQAVTGSILTNSGDMRFLEGAPTATGIQLSAFSGLTPYYVELNFVGSNAFEGALYTARNSITLIGSRNDRAALADPYSLTKLKRGADYLSFKLPNTDGQEVSLANARYKGKVVIVSILGTWCPNCLDEAQYLAQWYRENRERGVEIVGLSFERKDDLDYATTAVNNFKKRYGVDYEVLLAGKVGSESVAKVLPEVDKLFSYPTTFFIDRKGQVAKIYTGFNGPATGLFYEEWKKDFNDVVDGLLDKK
ncbi:MAG: TlpA family protein disulfide reductase [Dysgonamonadaceae bacterium]|jgi:peroxiredoxin|nr:TlpA family protein disulfide reductase [Dysgonamonadaceae bacterium]